MKKQLFTAVFCGVLLLLVGMLWWRVRELEKTVNSLRIQPTTSSTVGWQTEQQSKNNSPKKHVFKLIDSPPVDNGRSKVGVPWDVERAMIGGADHSAAPNVQLKSEISGQFVVPEQSDSK